VYFRKIPMKEAIMAKQSNYLGEPVNVRLSPETVERIREMAGNDCRTLSGELRWLIESALSEMSDGHRLVIARGPNPRISIDVCVSCGGETFSTSKRCPQCDNKIAVLWRRPLQEGAYPQPVSLRTNQEYDGPWWSAGGQDLWNALPQHKSLVSADGRLDLRANEASKFLEKAREIPGWDELPIFLDEYDVKRTSFNIESLSELNRVQKWWGEMHVEFDDWDYAEDQGFLSLVLDLVLDWEELDELVLESKLWKESLGKN
jgi:hypothetical protein